MKTIVLTEKRLLGVVMWAQVPVLTSGLEGEWLTAHRNFCRSTLRADDF